MMGAGALYVPPDPNAASGTNDVGNGKFAFKIVHGIFLGFTCVNLIGWR